MGTGHPSELRSLRGGLSRAARVAQVQVHSAGLPVTKAGSRAAEAMPPVDDTDRGAAAVWGGPWEGVEKAGFPLGLGPKRAAGTPATTWTTPEGPHGNVRSGPGPPGLWNGAGLSRLASLARPWACGWGQCQQLRVSCPKDMSPCSSPCSSLSVRQSAEN